MVSLLKSGKAPFPLLSHSEPGKAPVLCQLYPFLFPKHGRCRKYLAPLFLLGCSFSLYSYLWIIFYPREGQKMILLVDQFPTIWWTKFGPTQGIGLLGSAQEVVDQAQPLPGHSRREFLVFFVGSHPDHVQI